MNSNRKQDVGQEVNISRKVERSGEGKQAQKRGQGNRGERKGQETEGRHSDKV